jgi:hypothetical protein
MADVAMTLCLILCGKRRTVSAPPRLHVSGMPCIAISRDSSLGVVNVSKVLTIHAIFRPDPRKELKDVRCTCGALVCFAKPDIGDRLPFGIVPGGRPGASGSGAENGGTSHKQPGRPFHDAQDEGLQVMQIRAGVVSGFLPVRGSSRLLSGLRD